MKNIVFVGLTMMFVSTAAHAEPREDALSAMLRCSGISDKAQRLVCYDSAVVRVPAALNAAPPPIAAAAPPVRRERSGGFIAGLFGPGAPGRGPQTTTAQFGMESIADGGKQMEPGPIDGDTVDEISARLVKYDVDNGVMTLTLDNGQVWHQISGPSVGHLAQPASSYAVTVARGSAGAYIVRLSHFGRVLAVRRLR